MKPTRRPSGNILNSDSILNYETVEEYSEMYHTKTTVFEEALCLSDRSRKWPKGSITDHEEVLRFTALLESDETLQFIFYKLSPAHQERLFEQFVWLTEPWVLYLYLTAFSRFEMSEERIVSLSKPRFVESGMWLSVKSKEFRKSDTDGLFEKLCEMRSAHVNSFSDLEPIFETVLYFLSKQYGVALLTELVEKSNLERVNLEDLNLIELLENWEKFKDVPLQWSANILDAKRIKVIEKHSKNYSNS